MLNFRDVSARMRAERELRATQSELLATARRAGMAEIATNVLHNVGNVLNSVNISADLVRRKVQASDLQGLGKAVGLMNEHAADLGDFLTRDPKGKLLLRYLGMLHDALAAERNGLLAELGQLTASIEHIKEIVATQQSYAGTASFVEPVQIRDLVEDALRMDAGAMARHGITLQKEFAEVPVLPLDKHRILQILVNLIGNAKQAIEHAPAGADGACLRIRVADDGEGIAPDQLTRIFAHGFTTRKHGHGFGLHSCAVAAGEMGATLTAHSDGPGRGAAFTLAIPIPASA